MKPEKLTVYELFEKQKRYVVPLFQRPYVWNREDHWEPLWDDIRNQAASILEDTTPMPHFMGAVVLDQLRSYGKELDAAQIIDGQQRLTTLQIFLASFRDIARELDPRIYDELLNLTNNRHPDDLPKDRYKVWPTNADRPQFEDVLSIGSRSKIEEKYPRRGRGKIGLRPPIVDLYVFFSGAIHEFLEMDGTDKARTKRRLDALYEACRRRLHLVVIELQEREDDAQVIFETLNARGAPLLASDLVRNFIFLLGNRQGEKIESLYEQHWRLFDELPAEEGQKSGAKFWKIEETQGRLKRPRIDLFLQHFLSSQLKRDINVGRLYQEFKIWWNISSTRSLHDTLVELARQSEIFRELIVPDVRSTVGAFSRSLLRLDTSTLYPLMLLLLSRRDKITSEDLDGMCIDLESYLIRRLVCGLTSKNYNKYFLSVVGALSEKPQLGRGELQEELLKSMEDTHRWPDDGEFNKHWMADSAYTRLRAWRVKLILEKIEKSLLTSKQEGIQFDKELTIEHVMPQGWRENWPLPATNGVAQDTRDLEENRDRLLHTFGNLTLLTQPLNSAVSNGAYIVKRSEITSQSTLLMNSYFQRENDWNEDKIRTRGESLFNQAVKLWPGPKKPA